MNFVFISPNFPDNYWLFCQGLKKNGVNVLAIADVDYDSLTEELKNSISDYYRVDNLKNYDQMVRAIGYFTFKYGKIDWIESNNEYWLYQDAKLRRDFNVTTGIQLEQIDDFQCKSKMKEFYHKAGIKTARYHLPTTFEAGKAFVDEVGYPVVVKPNRGVGASNTYKIKNDEELKGFYMLPEIGDMIMEEFIRGSVTSYDGIVNSQGTILFDTSHVYAASIMDAVNNHEGIGCYSRQELPDELRVAGYRAIKAFDPRSRFFHLEFFILDEDQEGVGRKGDILGLEVNMRPPGGFIPDMINYASDFNIYQLWADMIVYDRIEINKVRKYISTFMGRKDQQHYRYSIDELKEHFGNSIIEIRRMPEIMAEAMGNDVLIARFKSMDEVHEFMNQCSELA